MNSQFILFLKKLSLLLVILFASDFLIGNILEFFYFRIKSSAPEHYTTYALNKAGEDIIVFGSSRAQHHYDPEPFEDNLHKSFYNTGKDGQGILYSYVVLKSILERSNKPHIILLDINPNEFHSSQQDYDRLTELLPYYHSNDVVKQVVDLKSPFEKFKAYSYLYRYNSLLLTIIMHNLPIKGDYNTKGFEPIPDRKWSKKLEVYVAEENIDTMEVNLFRSFLMEAKKANCEVYVAISPSYRKYSTQTQSTQIAETICEDLGINLLNFNQDTVFLNNPLLFVDPTHLNETGAELYSKLVSNKLSTHYNKLVTAQ
ncbi:hypothetical protein [Pontibacter sp. BAB1700]|uniref:hypothetical protein n=1 Tax=Pontibacter sp. BAB1700 TaxID=1144253 RepID=UPI00026BC217|nr:hypothetical protein [Pontibacter sp. BAB1700]EJF08063.1 hypothetical protein O71_23111 [Pontibacter sp. BAB1700]